MLDIAIKVDKSINPERSTVDILSFIKAWGLENLRDEDYIGKHFQTDTGKDIEYPSLAYRAIGTFIKYALNIEDINFIIPHYEILEKKYKNKFIIWTRYYLAEKFLEFKEYKKALEMAKKFLPHKSKEFWAWSLVAKIYAGLGDCNMEFACMCACVNNIKDIQKGYKNILYFIKLLVKRDLFSNAHTELEKIKSYLKKDSLEPQILNKIVNTPPSSNNEALKKNEIIAKNKFFNDLDTKLCLVDFINNNTMHLIFQNKTDMFFRLAKNIKLYDLVEIKFFQDTFDKIIVDIQKISKDSDEILIKSFEDTILSVANQSNVAFTKNKIFIDSNFVNKFKLKSGKVVKGKAMLNYNKKRNEWGYKAIGIEIL